MTLGNLRMAVREMIGRRGFIGGLVGLAAVPIAGKVLQASFVVPPVGAYDVDKIGDLMFHSADFPMADKIAERLKRTYKRSDPDNNWMPA